MALTATRGTYTANLTVKMYDSLLDKLIDISSTKEILLLDPHEVDRKSLINLVEDLVKRVKAPVIALKAEISIYNNNDLFYNSPNCSYHLQVCQSDRYLITKK